jgi:hypothetical protein
MDDSKEAAQRRASRQLRLSLALAAVAAPGLVPLAGGASDPLVLLLWLAHVAPATGAAAALLRLDGWPYGAAIAGAWSIVTVCVAGVSERIVPAPLWAMAAVAGLYYAGFAVGRAAGSTRSSLAPVACVTLLASWLPLAPGVSGAPWPAALASRLLDLSPATLVAECAGLDWMRTPGIYDPVGTDRFQRQAWSGELAGPASLLIGCTLWGCAAAWSRRRERRLG